VRQVIVAILAIMGLVGCRGPATPTQGSPGVLFTLYGVQDDPGRQQEMLRMWEAIRSCAGAPEANPDGLAVHVVLPSQTYVYPSGQAALACPLYPPTAGLVGGCSTRAEVWVLDWRGGPGWAESFGHEIIHVMRWQVSGRPDTDHSGPWWSNGRACQSLAEAAWRG